MSIIESKDKLIQVGLQIFRRNTMINTDDRLLEQRPESLDTIGVYVAIYGCLGVAWVKPFLFIPGFDSSRNVLESTVRSSSLKF